MRGQTGRAETRERLVGLKCRLEEVEAALHRRCPAGRAADAAAVPGCVRRRPRSLARVRPA